MKTLRDSVRLKLRGSFPAASRLYIGIKLLAIGDLVEQAAGTETSGDALILIPHELTVRVIPQVKRGYLSTPLG
jgi:hypothetical protein